MAGLLDQLRAYGPDGRKRVRKLLLAERPKKMWPRPSATANAKLPTFSCGTGDQAGHPADHEQVGLEPIDQQPGRPPQGGDGAHHGNECTHHPEQPRVSK